MTISDILRIRHLGQTDLSRLTGIPLRTVQDWASGRRQPPDYLPKLIESWLHTNIKEDYMKIRVTDTGKTYECTLNRINSADGSLDPDCLFLYDTGIITEAMFDYSHDVFAYCVPQETFTRFCDFWVTEVLGANTDRNYQGACLSALSDEDHQAGNFWKFLVTEF